MELIRVKLIKLVGYFWISIKFFFPNKSYAEQFLLDQMIT